MTVVSFFIGWRRFVEAFKNIGWKAWVVAVDALRDERSTMTTLATGGISTDHARSRLSLGTSTVSGRKKNKERTGHVLPI